MQHQVYEDVHRHDRLYHPSSSSPNYGRAIAQPRHTSHMPTRAPEEARDARYSQTWAPYSKDSSDESQHVHASLHLAPDAPRLVSRHASTSSGPSHLRVSPDTVRPSHNQAVRTSDGYEHLQLSSRHLLKTVGVSRNLQGHGSRVRPLYNAVRCFNGARHELGSLM